MLTTTTVTAKSLSKKLREQLGLQAEDRVRIKVEMLDAKPLPGKKKTAGGVSEALKKNCPVKMMSGEIRPRKNKKVSEVMGISTGAAPIKSTVEEMDEAVREAFRRGRL